MKKVYVLLYVFLMLMLSSLVVAETLYIQSTPYTNAHWNGKITTRTEWGQSFTFKNDSTQYQLTNFSARSWSASSCISCSTTLFNFTLYNESTNVTLLAWGSVLGASFSNGAWTKIQINQTLHPINNDSEVYMFVENNRTGADGYWQWGFSSNNYPDGQVYRSSADGVWSGQVAEDMTFRVYAQDFIPPPGIAGEVTLKLPLNSTTTKNETSVFSYNVSFDPTNCSLYTNQTGVFNITNTTTSALANQTEIFNVTLTDGYVLWTVGCNNGTDDILANENRTFFVDASDPTIDVFGDISTNQSFTLGPISATFNFTDNLLLHTYNISIDNTQIQSQTGLNTTFFQVNFSHDTSYLNHGVHNLTIVLADGHTANKLYHPQSYKLSNGIFNDYLQIEFEPPYKWGQLKIKNKNKHFLDNWNWEEEKDRFKFSFKPHDKRKKYVFTIETDGPITIIENDQTKYKKWLIYNDHWLDFMPYQDVELNRLSDNEVEVTINNVNEYQDLITFESLGDLNIVTQTYEFYKANVTVSFDNNTLGNVPRNHLLEITRDPTFISGADAILSVDGRNITPLKVTGSNLIAFQSIDSVVYTNTSIQLPLNWTFNITGPVSFVTNTTNTTNQTLFGAGVGLCAGDLIYPVVNITYYDQVSGIQLSAQNDYGVILDDGINQTNLTGIFSDLTPNTHVFCTNLNPTVVNYTWNMYGDMEITRIDYATKFFNIPFGGPIVVGNNPTNDLHITLLDTANATTIQYNWLTTSFQPIDGTLKIFECNVNGTKTLTESVVIVNGIAIANIVLLNKLYSYEVVIGDVTFTDSSFTTCHPEPSNTATYYINVDAVDLGPELGLLFVDCLLNKIGTDIANMTWTDNPESDTTIEGCLIGFRQTIHGLTQVYENCTTTGSIIRNVPDNGNPYYVTGEVRQGDSVIQCGNTLSFFEDKETSDLLGLTAIFAVILIISTLALIYASKGGDGMLMATGVGVIISFVLGIVGFGWPITLAIVCFVLVIAMIGRYSRAQ